MTSFLCHGQIIDFPDSNFKNAILSEYPNSDLNGDGEISVYEANSFYTYMHLDGMNISDLTGIKHFTTAWSFKFNDNNISEVDVSGMDNIVRLELSNNNITQADFSGLSNLNSFKIDHNYLTELNLSDSTPNSISANDNQLININLSIVGSSILRFLYLDNNALTTLDLNNYTNLKALRLNNNQLTSLDLSGVTGLLSLYCANNQLAELEVVVNETQGSNLYFYLDCSDNLLTDFSITSNIPGVTHEVNCSGNLFTQLDLSQSRVTTLDCSDNPLLEKINWRNGYNFKFDPSDPRNRFENLPNLSSVCYGPGVYQELADFILEDVGHSVDFYNNETCSLLGVNENRLSSPSVTPNPVSGVVNVRANSPVNKIILFNELGQKVFSRIINTQSLEEQIDVSALSKGLYFVQIIDETGNSAVNKIVKN